MNHVLFGIRFKFTRGVSTGILLVSFKVRTGCAASDGFPFSVSSDADDIGDQMSDSN